MPFDLSLVNGYSIKCFLSVANIPVSQWNEIVEEASVFLSLSYLKALEGSWKPGYRFIYVIVYKKEKPIAVLYFQAIDLSTIKIGSVVQAEPYGKFLKLVSDKITHALIRNSKDSDKWILVNGNMSASGMYGLHTRPGEELPLSTIYLSILNHASHQLPGQVSVSIVKDFLFENDFLKQDLENDKFIRFVMDPVMILNIHREWKNFDDYLQSLSSKYRLRASTSIEKLEELQFQELGSKEIAKYKSALDVLYQAVISKSPVRLVHPDINYIVHLKEQLGDHFKIKCWFKDGNPIAFYTTLLSHNETEAHHIGIDYHLNKRYSLYQNILLHLISEAIRNNSKRLNLGRTALEMKSNIGAIPENYAAYLKLNNKILNNLVKPFLPAQPPSNWVQRYPFRKF